MRVFLFRRLLARLLAPCAALLLMMMSACAPTPEADASPAKKILLFGNGGEPQDLDPHLVTGVGEHQIIKALFEGLVTDPPVGEGIAPGVAESWDHSPDGLVWTFRLRADARWSDGTPLRADDFLRSFRRILTPSLAAQYAYKLHHVVGAEEYNRGQLADFAATGFSAPDPHTLILKLKHRVPYLLEALKHYSWFPVPLHVLERHGPVERPGNPWTRPGRLVGNGPFVLETWKADQVITVSRSPTYWNAAAVQLDGIAFHAVTDANTEERMFRAGQLHVTHTLPADKIEPWRQRAPEQLRIDPYYGTYFYRINTTRPPLDDIRVRRALALAIDRRALVENVTRGGQDPALHFTPPLAGFTPADTLPAFSTETLAEARRLLAEAGYPGGRGLRRLEILYNTAESHRALAEAIQQMWRTGLGVEAGLRNEEWKVYLNSQDTLDYDLARAGWIADYPDPHGFLDLWVSGGGNNQTGFASPAYDRLFATALSTPDEPARLAVYRELDSLLSREVPIIPLYFYKRIYLLDPRVKNWAPDILDLRPWQHIDLAR